VAQAEKGGEGREREDGRRGSGRGNQTGTYTSSFVGIY